MNVKKLLTKKNVARNKWINTKDQENRRDYEIKRNLAKAL